ncbi:MAG TPA: hypothetical protein VFJ02_18810 [Vicinamibacterales bacterium]|nr:hypothetical protein [Vicinamibacterales bacterium]
MLHLPRDFTEGYRTLKLGKVAASDVYREWVEANRAYLESVRAARIDLDAAFGSER